MQKEIETQPCVSGTSDNGQPVTTTITTTTSDLPPSPLDSPTQTHVCEPHTPVGFDGVHRISSRDLGVRAASNCSAVIRKPASGVVLTMTGLAPEHRELCCVLGRDEMVGSSRFVKGDKRMAAANQPIHLTTHKHSHTTCHDQTLLGTRHNPSHSAIPIHPALSNTPARRAISGYDTQ